MTKRMIALENYHCVGGSLIRLPVSPEQRLNLQDREVRHYGDFKDGPPCTTCGAYAAEETPWHRDDREVMARLVEIRATQTKPEEPVVGGEAALTIKIIRVPDLGGAYLGRVRLGGCLTEGFASGPTPLTVLEHLVEQAEPYLEMRTRVLSND